MSVCLCWGTNDYVGFRNQTTQTPLWEGKEMSTSGHFSLLQRQARLQRRHRNRRKEEEEGGG